MVNIIVCGVLIFILISGLFLKEILGFLFIVSIVLLFSSVFNLCNHIIKSYEKYSGVVLMDTILKLIYYFLTALIFCCGYGQKQMVIFVVFYLVLLVLDVCFLHVQYNYQDYDLPPKSHIVVSQMIGLMYSYYKAGDKDALFGKQKEKKYVRSLAWIAVSYISVLVLIVFSTFVGNLNVDLGFEHIKIKYVLTTVFVLLTSVQTYFCWQSLFELPVKKWVKRCICFVSTMGLYILFFSPMISISPSAILASIYPFFCAFGIILTGALLYVLTLSSRYYLWCINKVKQNEKDIVGEKWHES